MRPAEPRGVAKPKTPAESTAAGWVAGGQPARARGAGSPLNGAATDLMGSVRNAALDLAPEVPKINAVPVLSAIGDGVATVQVPLKPGPYEVKGVKFKVLPGTTATMQVHIRNGELVPVGKNETGTQMKIDPPLDLPLWVTGRGAKLVGNDAKQKFQVELGGFFDLKFKATKLSDLAANGLDSAPAAPPKHGNSYESALTSTMTSMVDLTTVKVDAQVTMRAKALDLGGGVNVKVDPASTFSVSTNGPTTTLNGHVAIDDFSLKEAGVDLRGSEGSGNLSTTLTRSGHGFAVDSHLSKLEAHLDGLKLQGQSHEVAGTSDHFTLGPTVVSDGDVHFKSALAIEGFAGRAEKPTDVSVSLKGKGLIESSTLHVKDERDGASLGLSGRFDGTVAMGPNGVKVDAVLTHAHVDVGDLQESMTGNSVSIAHARADGDVTVHTDSKSGQLQIDGEVKNIDILVDDFKGGAGDVKADLGRTAVTGGGQFHVGKDGVQATGALHGSATVDAATFKDAKGHGTQLGSSTIEGDITKLNLGKGAPELRAEHIAANLKVKNAQMNVGQATMQGEGDVKAQGNVTLDAAGLKLDGPSQVSLKLDNGTVHTANMDLALGKGSEATLNITNLALGKTTGVTVAPGSKLDGVLGSGKLTVAGQTVELVPGGRMSFDVKHVDLVPNKPADVRGALSIDAHAKGKGVTLPPGLRAGGVTIHPTDVDGHVKLSLDDAHLSDNKLSFDGAQVSLEAHLGHLLGASVPGHAPVGTLAPKPPVLSVADVKAKSALAIAGVSEPAAAAPTKPVDALRLLKGGEVKLEVPLAGAIHVLGHDVLKFPPGTKLDLALGVRDGKIVPSETKVSLDGQVKALGVEIRGVHLDEKFHVHVDLAIAGKHFSVPVPGFGMVPKDVNQLADLAGRVPGASGNGGGGNGATSGLADLTHAQVDVSNATFRAGQLSWPGGDLSLTEGSKLSFHGTPMSGELSGSVALDGVRVTRDELALKGGPGRADVRVVYRRDGDHDVVDANVTNLSATSEYAVRKEANGDYVSLGKGKLNGAAFSVHTEVQVDERGLPKPGVKPKLGLDDVSLSAPNFSGELKAARVTSPRTDVAGTVELGPGVLDGHVSMDHANGLHLKGHIDHIDGAVAGVHLQRNGQDVQVDSGRLFGAGGTIDFAPDHLVLDTKQLQYDLMLHQADLHAPRADLKAGQTHISGDGRFAYDSKGELTVEGDVVLEGKLPHGDVRLGVDKPAPARVRVNRTTGIHVQPR